VLFFYFLLLPSTDVADLFKTAVQKTALVFRNALREAAERVFGQWCSQLVLASAGMELIFFLVADVLLC